MWADCGDVSSRSFLYKPADLISSSVAASCSLNAPYIRCLSSSVVLGESWRASDVPGGSAPVEDDLAALAGSGGVKGLLPLLGGEGGGDHRAHGLRSTDELASIALMAYQVSYISRP